MRIYTETPKRTWPKKVWKVFENDSGFSGTGVPKKVIHKMTYIQGCRLPDDPDIFPWRSRWFCRYEDGCTLALTPKQIRGRINDGILGKTPAKKTFKGEQK